MKKLFILLIMIVATAGIAYGEAFFQGQQLSSLRVTRVDVQNNTAQVSDANGGSAHITIGDTIGQNDDRVVAINKFYVTVKTVHGTTKLPVPRGGSLDGNRMIFN